MTDIHGNLSRLACFFNGYYEKRDDKFEKEVMSSYCHDDIFCGLFIGHLKAIVHIDERGRESIPRHLEKDELEAYMSIVNDSYLYTVQECGEFKPYHGGGEDAVHFHHVEKIITKNFPNILYVDALKLIKEINAITQYGYYEVHDYYTDDVYYHYKYIKIEQLTKILEKQIK